MVAHHFLDLVTVFTYAERGREGRASAGVGEEKVNREGGYAGPGFKINKRLQDK